LKTRYSAFIFLIAILIILANSRIIYCLPTIVLEDGRFYSHTTADLNGDGQKEIIAVGQRIVNDLQKGYIVAYEIKDNQFSLLADNMFTISFEGKTLAGRIRSLVVFKDPESGLWEIYVSGRGGEDETGVGFLKKYTYSLTGKHFQDVYTHVFSSVDEEYTHGYPITLWNIKGEKNPAVIYGGFSGGEKGDKADIRVFKTGRDSDFSECFIKPFSDLQIPLRVNALATGDIDGDGVEDILIAGRTKTQDMEVAALACYVNGNVYFKILDNKIPSRFRTLLIADLNNDGKNEILSGGRMDAGDRLFARLELWEFDSGSFSLKSTYGWTCDGSTRLRTLALHPKGSFFSAGGRSQISGDGSRAVWEGFIRHFKIENKRIIPIKKVSYFNEGPETRIRYAEYLKNDILVTTGFISLSEEKKRGFISLLPIHNSCNHLKKREF
jgi:hypothetical protein